MPFFVMFKAVTLVGQVSDKDGNLLGTTEIPLENQDWQQMEAGLLKPAATIEDGKKSKKGTKSLLPNFDFGNDVGSPRVAAMNNIADAITLPAKPPKWKKRGGKRVLDDYREEIHAAIISRKFKPMEIARAYGLDRQTIHSMTYQLRKVGKLEKNQRFYTLPSSRRGEVVEA